MEGNVSCYLNCIVPGVTPEIISDESHMKLNRMASLFKDFASSEYIMETHLNTQAAEIDFSFRVLATEMECLTNAIKHTSFSQLAEDLVWHRLINFINYWSGNTKAKQSLKDIWFEMDSGEHEKDIPQPCFFFNASEIKKGNDVDYDLLLEALKELLGQEQVELLRNSIISAIQCLSPETGLFQVGTMLARNKDRVRIFTLELTLEQTIEYLYHIGWSGSLAELDKMFKLVHEYSDGQYILDFDVTSEGIAEKIGINFGLKNNKVLPAFMENLVKHGLCNDDKRRAVLAWKGSSCSFLGKDYGQTAIIKNISHFKIAYSPGAGLTAKAYLRVAGVYLKELFKANLALTKS